MDRMCQVTTPERLWLQSRQNHHPWVWGPVLLLAVVGLMLIGLGQAVHANTLNVANNGVDSPSCGTRNIPCRSISQAIANANAGDTIEVGPGRYGDLNGNGTFGEPGEEVAQVGFGCFCMINVNKPVTLISSEGPLMTVLDAGGVLVNPVSITASGVIFGTPKNGFLLTGAGGGFNGLGCCFGASNITVAGNIATANGGAGFGISGSGNLLHDNFASENFAAGFGIFGSGNEVSNNTASSNGSEGFVMVGTGHVIHDNVASGNSNGFGIQGTNIQILQNSTLGNKFSGIYVLSGASAAITENNIYGNNNVPAGSLTNCGIENSSGNEIIATNNFWGASSGPGPDPADNAGPDSGCDIGPGSNTIVVPFAPKEFQIKSPQLL